VFEHIVRASVAALALKRGVVASGSGTMRAALVIRSPTNFFRVRLSSFGARFEWLRRWNAESEHGGSIPLNWRGGVARGYGCGVFGVLAL
jgi:hypothetical protein